EDADQHAKDHIVKPSPDDRRQLKDVDIHRVPEWPPDGPACLFEGYRRAGGTHDDRLAQVSRRWLIKLQFSAPAAQRKCGPSRKTLSSRPEAPSPGGCPEIPFHRFLSISFQPIL